MTWLRAGRLIACARCGDPIPPDTWVRFGDVATKLTWCVDCARRDLRESPPAPTALPAPPPPDTLFEGGRPSQRLLAMGPAEALDDLRRALAEKGR